ncbi:hypothetical protein H632_c2029p1, partial [Helicosporidium sp. ATCC 50920]
LAHASLRAATCDSAFDSSLLVLVSHERLSDACALRRLVAEKERELQCAAGGAFACLGQGPKGSAAVSTVALEADAYVYVLVNRDAGEGDRFALSLSYVADAEAKDDLFKL